MAVATFGVHGHEDVAGAKCAGVRTEARDGGTRGNGPAAFSPRGEVG